MKNKPTYAIESVDNALHLAQLLLLEGELRLTDAAERLGVSPSTAHRLLAMLVYRDFAERGSDRLYRPGPALRVARVSEAPLDLLRRVALPHLHHLVEAVNESANLVVRTGSEVRFLATVQCAQVLRVGDRAGKTLPACLTSTGKAMLAWLDEDELASILSGLPDDARARTRREIKAARGNGYAINRQQTESGLTAIGVALRDQHGWPLAGISLSMPTSRFSRSRVSFWVDQLARSATAIEAELLVR